MGYARPEEENLVWRETVSSAVAAAGIMDEEVEGVLLKAFSAVPRTAFLDGADTPQGPAPEFIEAALQDVDVPIGFGQFLTNPSLQVRMLALINLKKRMRVLEIGFGSGYLCAVMEEAGVHAFGIEQIGLLAQRTRKNLDRLGHHGVVVRRGEGNKGWSESGPYDAMVISYPVASEGEIPVDQLRRGGVVVGVLLDSHNGIQDASHTAPHGGAGTLTVWTRGLGSLRKVSFERVLLR
jgi:protein-L-isoaspartate(D-aspartate) O-methyltransferase